MSHIKWILACLALLLLCSPALAVNPNFTPIFDVADEVHINASSMHDTDAATPWWVWGSTILLGLGFFIYSLQTRTSTGDLERDGVVSVMAWFPLAYAAVTSFNVSMVTGMGVTGLIESQAPNGAINTHEYVLLQNTMIYHFPTVGIALAVVFVIAIVNTLRIISMHKTLKAQQEQSATMKRGELE